MSEASRREREGEGLVGTQVAESTSGGAGSGARSRPAALGGLALCRGVSVGAWCAGNCLTPDKKSQWRSECCYFKLLNGSSGVDKERGQRLGRERVSVSHQLG